MRGRSQRAWAMVLSPQRAGSWAPPLHWHHYAGSRRKAGVASPTQSSSLGLFREVSGPGILL